MELIKGYIKAIKVPLPAPATSPSAVIKDTKGDVVVSTVPIDREGSVAELLIPYAAVQEERDDLELHIAFTIDDVVYDRKIKLNVVTPYLELFEVEQILESDDEDECWEVESAVRHVINAHCGQEFGVTESPQVIVGNTESVLGTTRPIIRLDSLTEDGVAVFDTSQAQGADWYLGKKDYRIIGDGWFIKRPEYRVDSIKADRGSYYSSDPIKPSRSTFSDNSFINDVEYIASGRFGYDSVPDAVRQAAKLLVNDYACSDSLYRDRYLETVKSADWSIAFASGAWLATGNARADALLAPYVVNRVVVF